jgi:hypothetical protein
LVKDQSEDSKASLHAGLSSWQALTLLAKPTLVSQQAQTVRLLTTIFPLPFILTINQNRIFIRTILIMVLLILVPIYGSRFRFMMLLVS